MKKFEELIYSMDNDSEIMNYTFCDGTSLWLHVRTQLRLLYLKKVSSIESVPTKAAPKNSVYKYAFNTWIRRPKLNKKKLDILCIANYEGNPEIPNRMTWFVRCLSDFSSCELMYSNNLRPLPAIKNTFSLDYYYYRELFRNKLLRKKQSEKNKILIGRFSEQLKKVFKDEFGIKDLSELVAGLHHIDAVIVGFRKAINRYLAHAQPSLIVVSEGNNGDWLHGTLFSCAKELNIPTAEVQHGAFNLGMNYGDKLLDNEQFISQKTDYLFTFGPYHCNQMNVVKNCIPFGNYYLEQTVKQIKPKADGNSLIDILYVAEGIPASSINNGLARHTAAGLGETKREFNLVVRLHPTEKPNEKYDELIGFKNSRFSTYETDNIYQLIADSDIVIGHISTVLYESIYFNKLNYVYRDEISLSEIPENLGEWFDSGIGLAAMLNNYTKANIENPARAQFWAEGSVLSEFQKFWQSNIAIRKV